MAHKCNVCFDLSAKNGDLFTQRYEPERPHITRSREQVVSSASSGCEGCSILVRGLDLAVPELGSQNIWPFWQTLSDEMPLRVGHSEGGSVQFYVEKPNPSPRPMIGFGHPYVSCGLSSVEGFSQIFGWIDNCVEAHTLCQIKGSPVLPTRVLDVGSSDGDTIRLYESRGEASRYICLSHCWGSLPFIMTRKTNIEAHTKGIAWSVLTKTFQDAILVTRKLGVRWLWIDSLCIIQDDTEDWDRESTKMAAIYENSYVTLAATSAEDGNGGLFWPDKDCEFVHTSEDGSKFPIHVRRLALDHLAPSWYTRQKLHPLLYRGWCLQERLLAPRVLHFGANDVMWECRTRIDCECGGIDEGDNTKSRLFSELMGGNRHEINSAWRHVVSEYTHLALTVPSDRLPALSGLAKLFKRKKDTDYLAGLWRDSLLRDMLWFVYDQESPPEPIIWRAPSWSWAAAPDARIGFEKYSEDEVWHVTVVSATCNPLGVDPMGRVSGGSLVLKGRLVPANHFFSQTTESRTSHGTKHYYLKPISTGENEPASDVSWSHSIHPDRPTPEESRSTAYFSSSVYYLELMTDMKRVFIEPKGPRGNYYEHAVLFWVLRCVDESSLVYERIGQGVQSEDFEDTMLFSEVLELRKEILAHASSGNIFAEVKDDSVVTII